MTVTYAVPAKINADIQTAKADRVVKAEKTTLRRRVKALLGVRSVNDEHEFSVTAKSRKKAHKAVASSLSGKNSLKAVFDAIIDAPGAYQVDANGKSVTFHFIDSAAVETKANVSTSSLMAAAMNAILPKGAKRK